MNVNGGMDAPTGAYMDKYDHAARATAQIINLYVGSDEPKHVLYARIIFLILETMYQAERDLLQPSNN